MLAAIARFFACLSRPSYTGSTGPEGGRLPRRHPHVGGPG